MRQTVTIVGEVGPIPHSTVGTYPNHESFPITSSLIRIEAVPGQINMSPIPIPQEDFMSPRRSSYSNLLC